MKRIFIFLFLITSCCSLNGQGVGIGTSNPDQSSAVEISSTNKGILIPRMQLSQRLLSQAPAQGLMVYQTDNDTGFYYYQGTNWRNLRGSIVSQSFPEIILYLKNFSNNADNELWAVNLDGSNHHRVDIGLPVGWELEYEEMAKVTKNGQSILLLISNKTTNQNAIYRCNIDGSNLVKVMEANIGESLAIQALY